MPTDEQKSELAALITAMVTKEVEDMLDTHEENIKKRVQDMLDAHEEKIKNLIEGVNKENYAIFEATREGNALINKLVRKFIPRRITEFNMENFLKIANTAMTLAPLFDSTKKVLVHLHHPYPVCGAIGGVYFFLWLLGSYRAMWLDVVQLCVLIPGLVLGLLMMILLRD